MIAHRRPLCVLRDIRALAKIAAGTGYCMVGAMPVTSWERAQAIAAIRAFNRRDIGAYLRLRRAAGLNMPAQNAAERYLRRLPAKRWPHGLPD